MDSCLGTANDVDSTSAFEILSNLKNKCLVKEIVHYHSVGSTNEILKALADEAAQEGTVVLADEQTKGKGRLGRIWKSESNSGIYISLLLRPNLLASTAMQITLVAAVAVCRAITKSLNQLSDGKKK